MRDLTGETGRSLLYVVDSRRGHATRRARGSAYREYFERDGWRVAFLDAATDAASDIVAAAARHELVYLLKVSSLPLIARLRRETSARLVFDLTDPLWKPAHRRAGWHRLDRILRGVDAVFCENELVRSRALRFNRNVAVLPTCAQVERFDAARPAAAPRGRGGRVVVGWVGSRTTAGALDKVREPLRRVCARHPGVEVRVVGCTPSEAARRLGTVPHSVRAEYGEEDMIREMLALDIGIFPAPLDEEDYRVRGALKALLYMAAGLPVVCQAGGDCSALIEDGINGMLADGPEEWEAKLEALVASAERRHRMGEEALGLVRRERSLARVHALTRNALLDVLRREPSHAGFGAPPGARLREWAAGAWFLTGGAWSRLRGAFR